MSFPILVLVVVFLILLVLNVPVAFCMGIAAMLSILAMGDLPTFVAVAHKVATGIDSFALLAIPFFILSGLLMGQGGIAKRLIDFANVLVGRFRGGLAFVNILTCMFFGAISGSAAAAVSSVGGFMIPLMNKYGYEKNFNTSVTVTAATTGLLIPPSNVMIVYSLATGGIVSIAAIFIAGVIPGILVGLSLMLVAGIVSVKNRFGVVEDAHAGFVKTVQFYCLLILSLILIHAPLVSLGIGVKTLLQTQWQSSMAAEPDAVAESTMGETLATSTNPNVAEETASFVDAFGGIKAFVAMVLCLLVCPILLYSLLKRSRTVQEVSYSYFKAVPSLLLIVIVLGGILGGIFTATEASAVAVLYAFILAVCVYREVKIKEIPKILLQCGVTTAVVFLLIGTSMAMSWVLAAENVPQNISTALTSLSESKIIILLIINMILLAVGTFMDMTPAVLIFTPIFLPIVMKLGIHPLHFGIIMIMNLCIGLCTPPVGTCLFLGCGIGETTVTRVIRHILPFFVAMIVSLFICTYLDELSLWLPGAMGLLK